jgi:DNA primase catalytic core
MTVHKLTAGDGYTYLTRQVAAHDATSRGFDTLGAYYTERGEAPGVWMGSGLAAVPDFPVAGDVTEAQMQALFGEGRHPNARELERSMRAAGASEKEIDAASRLGSLYRIYQATQMFNRRAAGAFRDYNRHRGLHPDTPVPAEDRARIRSEIARRMFLEAFGREPVDARELSGHLARISRQQTTAVAGYDLTFSPVKSVSTLWAIAPKAVADIIEQAHHDAVTDTLGWIEEHAAYTRVGTNGVAQVETRGLLAAAFTHRDSRAGDPDLHTHVAISNKVQTLSGRWLALDGRPIFKNNVPASERYNTRLEALLLDRLGLRFAERPEMDPSKRSVREVVGIEGDLPRAWSSRRVAIDRRRADLSAQFQRSHGRPPTAKEAVSLAQQANLETRQRKHEPRSYAEQRATWREEAVTVLGGETQLGRYLAGALRGRAGRRRNQREAATLTRAWVEHAADTVLGIVSGERATWQQNHIRAEAERQARAAGIRLADLDHAVDAVVREALSPIRSIALDTREHIAEPALLRRSDGTSVYSVAGATLYTSAAVRAAEQTILAAAARRDGRTLTEEQVAAYVAAHATTERPLNPGQEQLVRELATSGCRTRLALAPAGTGKTTAMRVLSRAWTGCGGTVIGLAPSAAAAAVLREEIGTDTDTLAKLVWHINGEPATSGTPPAWMTRLGPDTLVIIDEAAMAGTVDLADAIDYITRRGGSVRLIGDDQQLAAIGAGGVLRDLAAAHGAVTLSQVMRFTDPTSGAPNHAEGAASLALRDGDPAAIGYYLDRGRVHVGDLSTCTDDAYIAWSADRAAGRDSIMLAPTRELVAELNRRARADRIAVGAVDPRRQVRLVDGSHASAGDTIISRLNDRKIAITRTDWVKNGDRWRVNTTLTSGALEVTHLRTGRTVTLPANYVRENVTLGYATTVHGAQGITADTCHTVGTGQESRQLLYVAMTRGRHANHLYLTTAGDGDPHSIITRDALLPPTAGDILARALERDEAPVSAASARQRLADPTGRLQAVADRYHHALTTAAEDRLGAERLADIDTAAETVVDGLTRCEAYPTLRAHLALLVLDGQDPTDILIHAAAASRGLADARDIAAVLDWRLDPSGHHPTGSGPLTWLPGIPLALAADAEWRPYLTERAHLVAELAAEIAADARAWSPTSAPDWAQALLDRARDTDHDLVAQLAVWRAATAVPDSDRRPSGPRRLAVAEKRAQDALDQRVSTILGDPRTVTSRWTPLADRIDARITTDPYWPTLADRLSSAERAGIDITTLIRRAATDGPLPDEQPAAALWWRLAAHLTPAAITGRNHPGTESLRPEWTPILAQLLGQRAAARVLADPAWPSLVAAVTHATSAAWTPEEVLDTAHQLLAAGQPDDAPLRDSELATALIWRIAVLTEHGDHAGSPTAKPSPTEQMGTTTSGPAAVDELAALADPNHTADEDWLASLTEPPAEDALPAPDRHEPPAPNEPVRISWVTDDDEHGALYAYPSNATIPRIRLLELNEQAADFYAARYTGSWAATYMTDRLGTNLAGDQQFRIGYAPDRWDALTTHLRGGGATDMELLAAGLAVRTQSGRLRDRFRDRLVFPITANAPDGGIEVHGFAARRNPTRADDDRCGPKYLNTAETDLFRKGHELYGLAEHRDALAAGARPVLVEGPVDALAVTLAGHGEYIGVAPLGTAFTDVQANRLRPYRDNPAGPVIVATDADTAGQQAAYRDFWQLAARYHNPSHILIPHGKDPAELYQTNGPDALHDLLDQSSPLADHIIAMCTAPFVDRLDTVEGRIQALRRAAPVVAALLPDQWSDRAALLSQRLEVSYGVALNEILDAHTAWSNDPNGQARAYAAERLAPLPPPTPAAPGDPTIRWTDLADRISPDLTNDRDWPTLAEHISRAADNGLHVDTRLPLLVADRPLDPAHRARDLDLRLIDACPDCLPQPDAVAANDNRERPASAAVGRLAAADLHHANAAVRAGEPSPPPPRRSPDRVPTTTPHPVPEQACQQIDRHQGPQR